MNEIQRITAAYRDASARGEAVALATVVAVRGSAYRRPGARMLIGADGRRTGSVSGGCLERDLMRQASRVLGGAAPILRLYDSTDEDHGAHGARRPACVPPAARAGGRRAAASRPGRRQRSRSAA